MIDHVICIQKCSKYLFQDDSFLGMVLDWDLRFGGSSSQGFNFLCTLSFYSHFPGCKVSYPWFCIFPLHFVHDKDIKYFHNLTSAPDSLRFNIPTIREFYGSTEGTYGTINIRNKEARRNNFLKRFCEKLFLFAQGACGFLPRLINYNPFALIRWNRISWRYFSTA